MFTPVKSTTDPRGNVEVAVEVAVTISNPNIRWL